jgi:uncharacterized protein DUF4476
MKGLSLLILLSFILPVFSFSQDRRYEQGHDGHQEQGERGSALTVFSENGDMFYLVINGLKQNNAPQTRVRVESLPEVNDEIQILFADNMTREIRKRITFADPVEGKAINLTVKIAKMQNGFAKLDFVKSTSLHDYHPEQGEYSMRYGNNVPQQQLTVNTPPPAPVEMDPTSFNDAKTTIANGSFESTKLGTAKTIFATNHVTTDQVIQVCNLFGFEDSKLDFAKFAYPMTVDPGNYFKIGNIFSFSSNKDALNDFISKNPR